MEKNTELVSDAGPQAANEFHAEIVGNENKSCDYQTKNRERRHHSRRMQKFGYQDLFALGTKAACEEQATNSENGKRAWLRHYFDDVTSDAYAAGTCIV